MKEVSGRAGSAGCTLVPRPGSGQVAVPTRGTWGGHPCGSQGSGRQPLFASLTAVARHVLWPPSSGKGSRWGGTRGGLGGGIGGVGSTRNTTQDWSLAPSRGEPKKSKTHSAGRHDQSPLVLRSRIQALEAEGTWGPSAGRQVGPSARQAIGKPQPGQPVLLRPGLEWPQAEGPSESLLTVTPGLAQCLSFKNHPEWMGNSSKAMERRLCAPGNTYRHRRCLGLTGTVAEVAKA